MKKKSLVAIIMGSQSDWETMKDAASALDELGIAHDSEILSAHRTPQEMAEFAQTARNSGVRVIIAGAGGAAHLPGMVASFTELPVIGVPVPHGPLQGQDALLSIVQMPKGVPVACVAIGNSWNAGILAAQILGAGIKSDAILGKVKDYKEGLRKKVKAMKLPLKKKAD